MRLILALLSWLLLGLPVALIFRRYKRGRIGLALMPIAGMLAIAGAPVLAAWLGISLAKWPLLAVLISITLAGVAFLLLNGTPFDPADRSAQTTPVGALAAGVAVFIIGVANVITGLQLSEGWPGYQWDGFSIWLLHANVLAGSESFPAALFAEPQLADSHWDYPLLLPSLFAWFIRLGGLELHELTIVIGLVAAILPAATTVGLTRIMPTSMAAVIGLCPFVMPGLVRVHYGAYADPLMVMLVVAALAWLTMGIAFGDRPQMVAGAFALTAVVATKNEGMLWALAILGMVFFLMIARSDILRTGATLIRISALPLAYFMSWKILCRKIGAENDLVGSLNFGVLPDRIGDVYVAVCQEIMALETLIILLLAVLSIALFSYGSLVTRFRSTLACLSAPLLYSTGMILIYSTTPHNLAWHLDTSLSRTMFGVLPAIITMSVCCYSRDLQPARNRRHIASLSNALH